MTTPLTPETEAGRRLAQTLSDVPHSRWSPQHGTFEADIAAIEAEARERRERVDPDLRALAMKAEEYIEAVVSYLDEVNQVTHSRRRHVDRTGEELAEMVAAILAATEAPREPTYDATGDDFLGERWPEVAATPDHTVVGEREAEIERSAATMRHRITHGGLYLSPANRDALLADLDAIVVAASRKERGA